MWRVEVDEEYFYKISRSIMDTADPQKNSVTTLSSTLAYMPVVVKRTAGTSCLIMIMTPTKPLKNNIANARNSGDTVINNFRYLSY